MMFGKQKEYGTCVQTSDWYCISVITMLYMLYGDFHLLSPSSVSLLFYILAFNKDKRKECLKEKMVNFADVIIFYTYTNVGA